MVLARRVFGESYLVTVDLIPRNVLQANNFDLNDFNLQNEYYTYLSMCQNDTGINVYALYQRECDKDNQVALARWGVFEVETFKNYSAEVQAYAAGVAEGILSRELIYYHFRNTIEDMCKGYRAYCKKLYQYVSENLNWIKKTVAQKPKSDLYWRQVKLLLHIL
ncbi:unnamed protein product [Anisakis simplex]|uniref:Phospholipase B-like n=1 Tax=Anisakis simplex TaxID=6269 RepID=A0A0M3KDE6_ANISI|nr:unnamed protein product [Anisakis simplex]